MTLRLFLALIMTMSMVSQSLLYGDPALDRAPVWSPDGSRIAFLRDKGGTPILFRIDADGGNLIELTNQTWGRLHSWSPDGSKIAYVEVGSNLYYLHVLQADGSKDQRILSRSAEPQGLVWSPDGSKLLSWDSSELYTIWPDGSHYTSLDRDTGFTYSYTWSPDGSLITFVVWNGSDKTALWTMKADGSDAKLLVVIPYLNNHAWSPNGQKIAFSYMEHPGEVDANEEIAVINADGSGLIPLTDHPFTDFQFSWSPDSEQLAYYSNDDIFVVNADGSQERNLTNGVGVNTSPVWSPDGSRIAFVSFRDNRNNAYTIAADGGDLSVLLDYSSVVLGLAWSPDGSQLLINTVRDHYSELYIIGANGDVPTTLLPDFALNTWDTWAWSPDGSKIALAAHNYGSYFELYLVDMRRGDFDKLTSNLDIYSFAWSPNGKYILFQARDVTHSTFAHYIIDVTSHTLRTLVKDFSTPVDSHVWSPDSRQIALAYDDVYLFDAASGKKTNLTNDEGGYHAAVWSPDGRSLAYIGPTKDEEDAIYVHNLASGISTRVTFHRVVYPYPPVWSPDSRKIAYNVLQSPYLPLLETEHIATDNAEPKAPPFYLIYLANADGSGEKLVSQGAAGPQWSPNGTYLLFSGSNEEMVVVDAEGSNPRVLTQIPVDGASWSPDSRSIVFASKDDLYLLHLPSGQ